MKKLILILICISCSKLFSKNFELIGGLNKNNFYNLNQVSGHFNSNYSTGLSYTLKFGIEEIKVDWLTMRFTLAFENYKGGLNVSDGGLGGGYTTIAEIDKSICTLGVFPVNFKIIKRINFNLGFEISKLIKEKFQGTASGWLLGQPNWSYNLQDKYDRFSSKTNFGLIGRCAYDFILTESIIVSPQYSYYFGISNEFIEFPRITRSKRQYFCIGIEKKIK